MTDLGVNVSRETEERLRHYLTLLQKWNPVINLVSKSTLDQAWSRHFVDSAQIYMHAPKDWHTWADLGSGGGFPGAVIAILAHELNPKGKVTLVESDKRKATFLRNVVRETGIEATIVAERIENIPQLQSDVISARALADLNALLGLSFNHIHDESCLIFPKGANWRKELTVANESWSFENRVIKSKTDDEAVILQVKGLARA